MNHSKSESSSDFTFPITTDGSAAGTQNEGCKELQPSSGEQPPCKHVDRTLQVANAVSRRIEDLLETTTQTLEDGTCPEPSEQSAESNRAASENGSLSPNRSNNSDDLTQLEIEFERLRDEHTSSNEYLKAGIRRISRFHQLVCFGVWGRINGAKFSDYAAARGLLTERDKEHLRKSVIHCLRVCHTKNKTYVFGPIRTEKQAIDLITLDTHGQTVGESVLTFAFGTTAENPKQQSERCDRLHASVHAMLQQLPQLTDAAVSASDTSTEELETAEEQGERRISSPSTDEEQKTATEGSGSESMKTEEQSDNLDPLAECTKEASLLSPSRDLINSLYGFPIATALQRVVRTSFSKPRNQEHTTNQLSEASSTEERPNETSTQLSAFWTRCVGFLPEDKIARWSLLTICLAAAVCLFGRMPYRTQSVCTVIPGEQKELVAPFEMELAQVFVQSGDRVKQGQLLAKFEAPALEEQRHQLAAELAAATTRQQQAQGEATDKNQTSLDASVSLIRAKLLRVIDQLESCSVSAPVDGFIVDAPVAVQTGPAVSKGQTLFAVAPLDSFRLALEIDASKAGAVATGQRGSFHSTLPPAQQIPFTLESVSESTRQANGREVRTATARIDLPTSELRVRPNLQGIAETYTGWQPIPWILFRGR